MRRQKKFSSGIFARKFPVTRWLLGLSVSCAFLLACSDFNGPWEFYPEEREVYTGIYTYGYVSADDPSEICFSKVYELDESASQDFAFYDSAHVTLKGKFKFDKGERDSTIILKPTNDFSANGGPNCFSREGFQGIVGESYKLDAYFEWDSSGHKAKSRYKALATIPNAVAVSGLNVPQQNGSYKWMKSNGSNEYSFKFLEFPMDMEFVKCAVDFDKTVGGVLAILNYDMQNKESVKTTFNNMFKGMTEEDSLGYRGIAMHDPLERAQNYGYTANRWIAGFNNLDTLYLMNMMLVIGDVSVDLYSTDRAYVDYVEKVKTSVSDSRIVPESNIEKGMGVFFGMARTTLTLHVKGDGVDLDHIAVRNCEDTEDDFSGSWGSRGCRLYQDVFCAGNTTVSDALGDLISANESAYEYYRDSADLVHWNFEACYPSHVKAAMMLDTTKWSLFLPDSVAEGNKFAAYSDGLKRYCVASNFKTNKIADCGELEKMCLEEPEKNYCKEYLWIWCADRGWDVNRYEQCRSALVSRYYLEEQKSSIIHREVETLCSEYTRKDDGVEFSYPICKNWCREKKGHVECK